MNAIAEQRRNERSDRRKSGIITLLVSLLVLLGLYFYKFSRELPEPKEEVTTMLVNFGDLQDGQGEEEPAPQEPSMVSVSEEVPLQQPEIEPVSAPEKTITGTNNKVAAPKVEKSEKKPEKKEDKKKEPASKPSPLPAKKNPINQAQAQGDAKGTTAVGNLIRGRGASNGSQGTGGTSGNVGDPLGGEGQGDSKIGIDRKLVAFIPGTMGRGGAQPSHNCSASGTITIAYTVDKAGNVVSARRSGGLSDPCVTSTTIAWVKQYVKAEKASTSSTGTYRITF
ncbi:ferric siderophore ABC transporter substrate-binding protein [Bergeyella sp. RCAD1439]|uniref:ferric siderophore ABC transporter substrate-binding protein n=1 Tax=Bergeyella anatis TaxID=3113737 RepID=UPI002E16FA4A|nr:ferric siderophore ABC transporter substrate-binding protein [Bergeyella sp. RCAD1439]